MIFTCLFISEQIKSVAWKFICNTVLSEGILHKVNSSKPVRLKYTLNLYQFFCIFISYSNYNRVVKCHC